MSKIVDMDVAHGDGLYVAECPQDSEMQGLLVSARTIDEMMEHAEELAEEIIQERNLAYTHVECFERNGRYHLELSA